MKANLTAVINDEQKRWEMEGDELVLGRDENADVVLTPTLISRFHARVTKREGLYYVADLGSRNGTFLNGKAIGEGSRPLQTGDEIVVAGAISLRFEDPMETPLGPRIGRVSGVWIDPESEMVWVDALPVEPPPSKAQVGFLRVLYERENEVVTRDQVIEVVWPDVNASGVTDEAVDGLFKRLRKRLRDVVGHDYVETVRGYGYRLKSP